MSRSGWHIKYEVKCTHFHALFVKPRPPLQDCVQGHLPKTIYNLQLWQLGEFHRVIHANVIVIHANVIVIHANVILFPTSSQILYYK
jgi:hypothetical protein